MRGRLTKRAQLRADLIAAIYDATLAAAGWSPFLDQLAAQAPDGFGSLLVRDDVTHVWQCAYSSHVDARVQVDYNDYYSLCDPWAEHFSILPVGQVCAGESLVTPDVLRRSEYCHDFLPRLGTRRCDGVNVVRAPSSLMALSVNSRGTLADGTAVRSTLRELLPHLQRAAQLYHRLGDLSARLGSAEAVLNQFEFGIVLVNPRGRIAFANHTAEQLFADPTVPLSYRRGVLRVRPPADDNLLQALVTAAVDCGVGKEHRAGGACRYERSSGDAALSVVVTPLAGRHTSVISPLAAAAAVIIVDEARSRADLEQALARQFTLTPREAAVLALLIGGASPAQAALLLGIAISTTRTHVRSLMRKLNCSRHSELVRVAVSSAAMLVTRTRHLRGTVAVD